MENIARIQEYVSGLDRERFSKDRRTRDAVERCLERVCEAAFRLGDEGPKLMPRQPWNNIRGMGNRLRHAYDRIGFDVLWNVIIRDLPGLKSESEGVLARLRANCGEV